MATFESDGAIQLLLLLALLIPACLFLLTQHNTLKRIRPENRSLAPGLVWLQLIPFLGQIWQFFVVTRIASSIRNELASWHNDSIFGTDALAAEQGSKKPTQGIGLAYCILSVSFILVNFISQTLYMAISFLSLGAMICWIIYWVNLAGWKRKLKQGAPAMA